MPQVKPVRQLMTVTGGLSDTLPIMSPECGLVIPCRKMCIRDRMQSYDFYKLYKEYGCRLEFGGDDQWSNIIGGVELIRRKDVYKRQLLR